MQHIFPKYKPELIPTNITKQKNLDDLEVKQYVLYGGGFDSTALVMHMVDYGSKPTIVHFDYGQNAVDKEREAANKLANKYNLPVLFLSSDFSFSKSHLLSNNPKHDDPKYDNLEARNPLLVLKLAARLSYESNGFLCIFLGFHKEPDDTPFFDGLPNWFKSMEELVRLSCNLDILIQAPFSNMSRQKVFNLGHKLSPDFETIAYTCYESQPCGICRHCKDYKILKSNLERKTIRKLN